jgi:hypothetical protein
VNRGSRYYQALSKFDKNLIFSKKSIKQGKDRVKEKSKAKGKRGQEEMFINHNGLNHYRLISSENLTHPILRIKWLIFTTDLSPI